MAVMSFSLNSQFRTWCNHRLTCVPSSSWLVVLIGTGTVAVLFIIFTVIFISAQSHNFYQRQSSLHDVQSATVKVPIEATDTSNPNYHYGVVLDCGSSGTRVYVYFWPKHSGNKHELLQIQQLVDQDLKLASKKISPGLSSFNTNTTGASDYVKPLLDFAASYIPSYKHRETPLYILATAGMRMLSKIEQDAILDDLRLDIPLISEFLFSESHVEIISGKQEGLFAWIAMNYIAGRFDHTYDLNAPLQKIEGEENNKAHYRKRTVGIIDMGGGSVQIAFEVPKSVYIEPTKMYNARNYFIDVKLGCKDDDVDHTYKLYVATFLGYGANSARDRYEDFIINNASRSVHNGVTRHFAIPDPCLSLGMIDRLQINATKTVYLKGTGDFTQCLHRLTHFLNLTVPCTTEPCSMNGVYQPPVDLYKSEFYGFSEYWYSSEDVLRMGGPYNYLRFKRAASQYCSTPWVTAEGWYRKNLYPLADRHRFKFQCFKSAWVTAVLHNGFHVPTIYKGFTSASLVRGKDVQWTLGALIYKTKYYPLSELQKHVNEQFQPPWIKSVVFNEYILVLCIVVVAFGILLYWRRLHHLQRTAGLRRVPTMTYFMTEADQVEQGVKTEWAYGLR